MLIGRKKVQNTIDFEKEKDQKNKHLLGTQPDKTDTECFPHPLRARYANRIWFRIEQLFLKIVKNIILKYGKGWIKNRFRTSFDTLDLQKDWL